MRHRTINDGCPMTSPTVSCPRPRVDQGAPRTYDELPGPKPWPLVGNALQVSLPRMHQDIEAWSRQYGPVFRARLGNVRMMVMSDHEMISAMLRDRPEGFKRPARLLQVISEMGIKTGVFLAEGEAWQNQRRMVMAGFSPANVRAYFPALLRVTQRLRGRWREAARTQAPIDLQADLMRYTVDAISGLAFGVDTNTLESDEDVIQRHLDKIFPAVHRRTNALVPYWRYVRLPVDRALDESIRVVSEAIRGFIAQARGRLARDEARRAQPANVLEAMILAADQAGSGVNDDDVAGNVFTLLLAGEDTTATTPSWMIYLLSRQPEALRLAREEAHRVLGGPGGLDTLTPEQVADLNYIEACAHEAMRLKPVGPFNVVEALRDTVVGDVLVPQGMLVICVLRADATSERYFADAADFNPQRWLDGQGVSGAASAKRVSMPFGAGPRVCPGRYLALLEIKLAMAMLLTQFDIDSVATPDGQAAQEHMAFTMTPVGLRMRLKVAGG